MTNSISRRDFLKIGGAAAGAGASQPRLDGAIEVMVTCELANPVMVPQPPGSGGGGGAPMGGGGMMGGMSDGSHDDSSHDLSREKDPGLQSCKALLYSMSLFKREKYI